MERNLLVVEVVSAASEASDEDVDSFSGPVSVTRVHFEAMWIGWKATACFRIDSKLQSKDSRGTDLDLMVTFGRKNNCRLFRCWLLAVGQRDVFHRVDGDRPVLSDRD